ncbi:AMP-binding protein, partial [Pseudomonas sp. NPDC089554]|uniref:AMP-binding protein n=1 Tax=Pseudomonas sp. NPDC089554 TaxID=3390653 RepID=UPI003CFFE117
MVANDQAALSELSILGDAEREQVLHAFNATAYDYPAHEPLHALFEAQARRRPEAKAIEDGERSLSYRQLDQRAERLADWLAERGVRPGDCVALCLERGPRLVAAILAILKNGATYVPIDTATPVERQHALLHDCASAWLLGEGPYPHTLPTAVQHLDLAAWESTSPASPRVPVTVATDAPAYVMYTSGSTGTPKGVQVPHRAIVRLVRNNG